MLQEYEEKPEDCIPEDPGNEDARKFLAHAPTKGLWMPLGKEVKVMQCEYTCLISIVCFWIYMKRIKCLFYSCLTPPDMSALLKPGYW